MVTTANRLPGLLAVCVIGYLCHSALALRQLSCKDTRFSITCQAADIIVVERAVYGVLPGNPCAANVSATCQSPLATRHVNEQCSGRSGCAFDVTADLFPDICIPNDRNALAVDYKCVDRSKLWSICDWPELPTEGGYIASPDYPKRYPKSTKCVAKLSAGPGKKVYTKMLDVDLENRAKLNQIKSGCHDSVVLQERDFSYYKFYYCGKRLYMGPNSPVERLYDDVIIEFFSDDFHSDHKRGFLLRYEITSDQVLTTTTENPDDAMHNHIGAVHNATDNRLPVTVATTSAAMSTATDERSPGPSRSTVHFHSTGQSVDRGKMGGTTSEMEYPTTSGGSATSATRSGTPDTANDPNAVSTTSSDPVTTSTIQSTTRPKDVFSTLAFTTAAFTTATREPTTRPPTAGILDVITTLRAVTTMPPREHLSTRGPPGTTEAGATTTEDPLVLTTARPTILAGDDRAGDTTRVLGSSSSSTAVENTGPVSPHETTVMVSSTVRDAVPTSSVPDYTTSGRDEQTKFTEKTDGRTTELIYPTTSATEHPGTSATDRKTRYSTTGSYVDVSTTQRTTLSEGKPTGVKSIVNTPTSMGASEATSAERHRTKTSMSTTESRDVPATTTQKTQQTTTSQRAITVATEILGIPTESSLNSTDELLNGTTWQRHHSSNSEAGVITAVILCILAVLVALVVIAIIILMKRKKKPVNVWAISQNAYRMEQMNSQRHRKTSYYVDSERDVAKYQIPTEFDNTTYGYGDFSTIPAHGYAAMGPGKEAAVGGAVGEKEERYLKQMKPLSTAIYENHSIVASNDYEPVGYPETKLPLDKAAEFSIEPVSPTALLSGHAVTPASDVTPGSPRVEDELLDPLPPPEEFTGSDDSSDTTHIDGSQQGECRQSVVISLDDDYDDSTPGSRQSIA